MTGDALETVYYCGGGMTDAGSRHAPHLAPQFKGDARWCCGDPDLAQQYAVRRDRERLLERLRYAWAECPHAVGWCEECVRTVLGI